MRVIALALLALALLAPSFFIPTTVSAQETSSHIMFVDGKTLVFETAAGKEVTFTADHSLSDKYITVQVKDDWLTYNATILTGSFTIKSSTSTWEATFSDIGNGKVKIDKIFNLTYKGRR